MTGHSTDQHTRTPHHGTGTRPSHRRLADPVPHLPAIRDRGGRRLLPALASAAVAAALPAGCGAGDTGEAGDDGTDRPSGTEEESSAPQEPTSDTAPPDDATTEDGSSEDDGEDTGDGEEDADDDTGDDGADDGSGPDDGSGTGGENLFEGTWTFGHDTKVLDAAQLAELLEEEAESRGPEEMSLDVECADGVDTGAGDDTAECTAYADEGVEHVWLISVGPADAGLVIEVENQG